MMSRRKRRRGARGLLAAVALLCLTVPHADAQRSAIRGHVEVVRTDVRSAATEPLTPQRRRNLRACGSMHGDEAREIARGPEPVRSRTRWLDNSYRLIRDIGPLPLCFEHLHDTLTSREGRRLLDVNNYYLRQHRPASYWLVGFTDPVEQDTALARRRAEEVHQLSHVPDCHQVRRGAPQVELRFQRRVYYSPRVPSGCRSPHRR